MQEEQTIRKTFKLIYCCNKFKQIRNDVFVNVKIRYNFWLSHENKFTIPLISCLNWLHAGFICAFTLITHFTSTTQVWYGILGLLHTWIACFRSRKRSCSAQVFSCDFFGGWFCCFTWMGINLQRRSQNPFKHQKWRASHTILSVDYFHKALHLRCL